MTIIEEARKRAKVLRYHVYMHSVDVVARGIAHDRSRSVRKYAIWEGIRKRWRDVATKNGANVNAPLDLDEIVY